MSPNQRQFLLDECFSLTLMATVQRGRVYRKTSDETGREGFRRGLRSELEQLSTQYREKVAEADHIRNIAALADSLSKAHSNTLTGKRFRIGSARRR